MKDYKKYLEKVISEKTDKKEKLLKRAKESEDINEVRSIGELLNELAAEIEDAKEQLSNMDNDGEETKEGAGQAEEQKEDRSALKLNRLAAFQLSGNQASDTRSESATDSVEYRTAFMNFVMNHTAIPNELRANANTTTSDVGGVIPTILVNKIIEKLESTGMIYPLVTKTNYAAGYNIPTSSIKPVATWVTEGKGSDRQKKTTGVLTFTHHKLRCEVSVSMEVKTMTLSAFEAKLVENISEAMMKAIEQSIINGDGSKMPSGILRETPAEGQAIEIESGAGLSYQVLVDAEAAIPQAYENKVRWCMTKKTFLQFIGMVDANKQPIARINYGIGGKPERTLLGREVVLCGDYMDNFVKSPTEDTTFAFLFNFEDYALNSIYDMGIQKKQDWDTEDILTKAVMSTDGKVIDKNSLVTVTVVATGAQS